MTTTVKTRNGIDVEQLVETIAAIGDEPPVLLGSNQGPNAVELLLQGLAFCYAVGYVANAAAKVIEIESMEYEIEGDFDVRSFLGLEGSRPGFTRSGPGAVSPAPTPTGNSSRSCASTCRRPRPCGTAWPIRSLSQRPSRFCSHGAGGIALPARSPLAQTNEEEHVTRQSEEIDGAIDLDGLQVAIRTMYRSVAADPKARYHFCTGKKAADHVGTHPVC